MAEHEESEIIQGFGQMVRTVLGSGMQAAEQAQRRQAMQAQENAMNDARERAVAQMIGRDFASDKFWRTAGSEDIADRMTVAATLVAKHGAASEAAHAYVAGADRIRNKYGINVEDINRDHPTAPVDRHRALRDALDDYLASQRAQAENQKLPHGSLQEEKLQQEASEAQQHEDADMRQASRFAGEERLDQTNTEIAESKQIHDAEKLHVNRPQQSDAANRIVATWKEYSGGTRNLSLPHRPSLNAQPQTHTRPRRVLVGQGQGRQQGREMAR